MNKVIWGILWTHLPTKVNSCTRKVTLSQLKISRPPVPSVLLPFSWKMRNVLNWIEWKINFPIFIFWVIVKIHRKFEWFEYKNDHNSKKKNLDAFIFILGNKKLWFSSYGQFWSFLYSHHSNFRWIFTITREKKIGKLIFQSFQHIANLS